MQDALKDKLSGVVLHDDLAQRGVNLNHKKAGWVLLVVDALAMPALHLLNSRVRVPLRRGKRDAFEGRSLSFVGFDNRFRHLFERVAPDEVDDFDLIAEAVDFVAWNIFDDREYPAGADDSSFVIDAVGLQSDKRLPDMMWRLIAAQNKKANRGIGNEVADHFLDSEILGEGFTDDGDILARTDFLHQIDAAQCTDGDRTVFPADVILSGDDRPFVAFEPELADAVQASDNMDHRFVDREFYGLLVHELDRLCFALEAKFERLGLEH